MWMWVCQQKQVQQYPKFTQQTHRLKMLFVAAQDAPENLSFPQSVFIGISGGQGSIFSSFAAEYTAGWYHDDLECIDLQCVYDTTTGLSSNIINWYIDMHQCLSGDWYFPWISPHLPPERLKIFWKLLSCSFPSLPFPSLRSFFLPPATNSRSHWVKEHGAGQQNSKIWATKTEIPELTSWPFEISN